MPSKVAVPAAGYTSASLNPAEKKPGGRRQHGARAARGFKKFDMTEMNDILLASELVPSVCANLARKTEVIDSDVLSTVEPSSAEQSPELGCMPSGPEAWPSLREAECGWDFCSEKSDSEEEWEALPEPALALDSEEANLWLISDKAIGHGKIVVNASDEADEETAKPSFADLCRNQQTDHQPPASGTAKLRSCVGPVQRRAAAASAGADGEDPAASGSHGNGRERRQRASWNLKQRHDDDDGGLC